MSFIVESNHTYVFTGLGISKYQMDRRKKDLLIWLTNFYDYTIIPGSPERIKINEVFGDYDPMPTRVVDKWRQLLSKYKISETEASNAFYKYAQGDNIDLELGYYHCALAEFQEIYDDTPVLVKRWRLKKEYQPPKDEDDDALK